MDELRVVAFVGSLRRRSYNRALFEAAVELAPAHVRIESWDRLAGVPAYDQDIQDDGAPEIVSHLRSAIAEADGVLFVMPEYNYGIPGFLKNAIDWASRPGGRSALKEKPTGIIGTSPGPFGTVRGQQQMRTVLQAVGSFVMPQPQVLVMKAKDRFDDDLKLVDETTRRIVADYMVALDAWIRRLRPRSNE